MANLRSMEAAHRGWAVFKSETPRPSCDEINERLGSGGLPAISDRMYKHYRRLERHRRDTYVPINELDVQVKGRGPEGDD